MGRAGIGLSMSLYEPSIVQTKKMLNNLKTWLDHGKEYANQREFDPNVLLTTRLAPDQFALGKQVQIACDTAKLTAARLTNKDAPSFEDTETTIEELQARIDKTIAFLETLTEADFNGAQERLIALPFAPGKGAKGLEYYLSFAQPNFYFHSTTAYALLRHAGVPLGKRAFIGSMHIEDLPA